MTIQEWGGGDLSATQVGKSGSTVDWKTHPDANNSMGGLRVVCAVCCRNRVGCLPKLKVLN